MSRNQGLYQKMARAQKRRVFFTASTALKKGIGVCYDRDRGTATDFDGERDQFVELPSQGNAQWFAGVTCDDYTAKTGGQWIHIYEPGGTAEVAINVATAVASTRISCLCNSGAQGSGRFIEGGLRGRGSALALQTFAALTSNTDTTPGVGADAQLSLLGTVAWTASSRTLTLTNAFTFAAAGDKVYIVAGADASTVITPVTVGEYTIESVTSVSAVVLTTSCAAADSEVACYLVRGNPTCLAYLEDGPPEGMIEWLTPIDNLAVQSMVGGSTLLLGGSTLGNGDATSTLANGTYIGQQKYFRLNGALTTQDYLLTITRGIQLGSTTDLNSLEFDADQDEALLAWCGSDWRAIHIGPAGGGPAQA